jgi:hypothetical protein
VDLLIRLRRAIAFALAVTVLAQPQVSAGAGESSLSEYEVKAGFLVNFAKFVTWPADAFASPTAPIVIGIVGDDPFGAVLDDAARTQRVGDRPIQVKRVGTRDELSAYHVVFVSASEEKQLGAIIKRLEQTRALTVSDIERFCSGGGVIGFVSERSRVRFEINVGAADARGLKISTRLMALASKVYTP